MAADDARTSAEEGSADANDRLLRHIESRSVDTSDLLDMLEAEVRNLKKAELDSSSGDERGEGGGAAAGDGLVTSLHSLGSLLEDEAGGSSSGDDVARGGGGGKSRPSKTAQGSGYGSGDSGTSLGASFTSKLLGGDDVFDERLEEQFYLKKDAEDREGDDGDGDADNLNASRHSSGGSGPPSSGGGSDGDYGGDAPSPSSPGAGGGGNEPDGGGGLNGSFNGGSGSDSKHAAGAAPSLLSRPSLPSFNNPFRSSASLYNGSSGTDRRSSDGGGGGGGRGNLSDYGYRADVSGSDGTTGGGGNSGGGPGGFAGGANRHLQRYHARRSGGGGGGSGAGGAPPDGDVPDDDDAGGAPAEAGVGRSVSFSIREEGTALTAASGTACSGSRVTRSTQSTDTFSLGSLATGLTSQSATTHSSRTSRSSRSATTASTHSTNTTNSTQERRVRRELVPSKQDGGRRRRGGGGGGGSRGGGGGGGGDRGSTVGTNSHSGGSGSTFGGGSGAFGSAGRRSRKKSGDASSGSGSATSRNLYNGRRGRSQSSTGGSTGGNSGGGTSLASGEYAGGNLHDRHPIRYPKRSGQGGLFGHIEEEEENYGDDEGDNAEEGGGAEDLPVSHVVQPDKKGGGSRKGGRRSVNASDKSSIRHSQPSNTTHSSERKGDEEEAIDTFNDDDGLFLRVNKVRNEIMESSGGKSNKIDFIDGLIASTTRGKLNLSLEKLKANENRGKVVGDDGAVSVGDEASFLSDLLRKRRGGSVISGKTSELSGRTTELSDTSSLTHNTSGSSLKYGDGRHYGRGGGRRDDEDDTVIRAFRRYYQEGGDLLPKTRKEWVVLLFLALLLSPMVHVAVTYLMVYLGIGGYSQSAVTANAGSYYGAEMQYIDNQKRNVWDRRNGNGPANAVQRERLYSEKELMSKAWAGSSQVMLGKSSSLREDMVLIPDADWVELQISRGRADRKGTSGLFGQNSNVPKPPQRLPLPSKLDPLIANGLSSADGVVVYSLTAANFNSARVKSNDDLSRLNARANAALWDAIQTRLSPRPIDAWPCWSHNSLARFREDGFAVLYPLRQRSEARVQLAKLAREFDQGSVYEFVTLSETPSDGDAGLRSGAAARAGSVRRIGKDGSALIVPALPDGRSDVMVRRTISTRTSVEEGEEEPAVVMRRVRDLPVEDELTVRKWEGPPLEEIVWN